MLSNDAEMMGDECLLEKFCVCEYLVAEEQSVDSVGCFVIFRMLSVHKR